MSKLPRIGGTAASALSIGVLGTLAFLGAPPPAGATPTTFLAGLHQISEVGSTVPSNGDVNPYGVAVVPASMGLLHRGDTLVSNFNDSTNVQGTGTTIVEVAPTGSTSLFSQISSLPEGDQCPGGIGLTTALGILPGGWVVVGSLATSGGTLPKGDPAGCLIVLNNQGTVAETFTNRWIDGPWDMATTARGSTAQLFVSDALGFPSYANGGVPVVGIADVVRLDLALRGTQPPILTSTTVIGVGFPFHANKTALVLAPTGLALGQDGTLYVDDTQTNAVSAIRSATVRATPVTEAGTIITSHGWLDAPLGMTLAPNGDLVVVNGGNGNAVEISPTGHQLGAKTLITTGAGDLFGLVVTAAGTGLLFVDDGTNTLELASP